MAYILKKIGNVSNIPAYHFECDNNEDILEIPLAGVPMSSTCYVINEGTMYTLNSEREWVITMRGGTGGNGGGGAANGDAVLYTQQALSEEQQMQARENLGLYSKRVEWVCAYKVSRDEASFWDTFTSDSNELYPIRYQCSIGILDNDQQFEHIFDQQEIQVKFMGSTFILPRRLANYSARYFGNYGLLDANFNTGEEILIFLETGRYTTDVALTVPTLPEDQNFELEIYTRQLVVKQIEPEYVDLSSKPGKNIYNENGGRLGEVFNDSDNIATGLNSHAEGGSTKAVTSSCHAEGSSTVAGKIWINEDGYEMESWCCHAEGWESQAIGNISHAEGIGTIAAGLWQHAEGAYNIADTENKYVHIVGNGDNNIKRSNAHTLDWDGNAWYAGYVESKHVILTSPNGTRFKVSVGDDGTLSATQVTE